MPTHKLTNEILTAAILGFEEQKRRIDVQIADIRAQLSGAPVATPEGTGRKRRTMSAAARKAIGDAQRNRWAASKAQSVAKAPKAKKRKLSAAGRAAIIAALKKRWAAKKKKK